MCPEKTEPGSFDEYGVTVLCGAVDVVIKGLPAVDAAPVIRCANCKWWNGSTLGVAHRCVALHIATTGEFYCAAAERKSNAFADDVRTVQNQAKMALSIMNDMSRKMIG